MRDLFDAVYALLIDRLERQALADRTGALLIAAFGGLKGELPSFAERRARFDEVLCEEPRRLEPEELEDWELRRALGVA